MCAGDTLFALGCGRLFEGTAPQMWQSLKKLFHIPAATHVCCGHEYTQSNANFAAQFDQTNDALQARKASIDSLQSQVCKTCFNCFKKLSSTCSRCGAFLRICASSILLSFYTLLAASCALAEPTLAGNVLSCRAELVIEVDTLEVLIDA